MHLLLCLIVSFLVISLFVIFGASFSFCVFCFFFTVVESREVEVR